MRLSSEHDRLAVAMIRGLAMDAPLHAKSGHQGTAMALAPLAHVLYSRVMRHDPANPSWSNRDRFILSNGHASILQYALLFLQGYGVTLDDLRAFRSFGSNTPGHPESGHTPGVEVTTGPLGQGFANAVGMAMAERHLRARFGAGMHDHHVFVVAGDGCLMEGVSHEAASFAGHQKLDRLICIFDDNGITIDGSTALSCSDDVVQRFRAYGWNVVQLGEIADDLDALESALLTAKAHTGSPTLLVLRSHIGVPSPDFTDRHEAHGNPFTAAHVTSTKAVMGIPDVPFWVDDESLNAIRSHSQARADEARGASAGAGADDVTSIEWARMWNPPVSNEWISAAPTFDPATSIATRVAVQKCIDASITDVPGLLVGSADLTGNTGAKISGATAASAENPDGRQVYYGIREHAMGAIAVGMALHGGVLPVVGTFFVFADYMRPALRLAALSQARVIFVFSHDSVGVGEDGPTHQPVEHLASLRVIPGLRVVRPADANETIHAWRQACDHHGPTALILSRQNTPIVTDGHAVARGAATVRDTTAKPDVCIVATGTEVAVAVDAATRLQSSGVSARVVSMPSMELFLSQDPTYRSHVMPVGTPVVSIEAGSTFGWSAIADDAIGIDRFGASAPGGVVMERLGISADNVVMRVRDLLDVFDIDGSPE
jgi:transketolase